MAAIEWPVWLAPRSVAVAPIVVRAGVETMAGQAAYASGVQTFRWRFEAEFPAMNADRLDAMNALLAGLRSGGQVWFPLRFNWSAPYSSQSVTLSDGTTFSDGSAFAVADANPVTASLLAPLQITCASADDIRPGQWLNVGADLYQVRALSWSGTTATIETTPARRRAYVAAPVSLAPYVQARLVNFDGQTVTLGNASAVRLTLEEVVN